MKQAKRPTVAQRKYIEKSGVVPSTNWGVVKWSPNEIVIQNKLTGEVKTLEVA